MLASALRLGIIPTLSPYLLPLFLRRLHQTYLDLRLILREDTTGNLLKELVAHELDVLLLALPNDQLGLCSLPLFDEPFWLACPAGHPLADKPAVSERDLAGHKLLLLDEGHCLREQALAVCGQQPSDPASSPDDLRATSLETICEMVAAGLGCTLLPALAVPRLAAKGLSVEVRRFTASGAYRRVGLLWRTAFPRSDDVRALGKFVQEQLPDGVHVAWAH